MSSIKVFDIKGSPAGEIKVDDKSLVLEKGEQAVHDVIVATMAAKRLGSASTLRKGEVAGSNKKPWKQKGTGRARAGLRQSPVWRGGGVAFGPHPRDYTQKINKKVAKLAYRRAFSEKIANDQIKIVDLMETMEPKTKTFVALLKKLGISKKVLVVLGKLDQKVIRSARNIAGVEISRADDVNIYQLINHSSIVADKSGYEVMMNRFAGKGKVG